MENSNKLGFFILYRNGSANLVDQSAWEHDWLRWWKSVASKGSDSQYGQKGVKS